MRNPYLASLAVLVVGTGLAAAQPSEPTAEEPRLVPVAFRDPDLGPAPVEHGPALNFPGAEKAAENGLWFRTDYLVWWFKDGPTPGPVTITNLPAGLARSPLATFNPGTVLGSGIDYGTFSGFQGTFGGWFDCDHVLAWETSGFWLERRSKSFGAAATLPAGPDQFLPLLGSLPDPVRTVIQPLFGPGSTLSASSTIAAHSRFWQSEDNIILNAGDDENVRLGLLAGVRFLDLKEDLTLGLGTIIQAPTGPPGPGNLFTPAGPTARGNLFDSFQTINHFYAGQVGARGGWCGDGFSVEVAAKLGLGVNHEVVDIYGARSLVTTGTTPPLNLTAPGGFLAQASNIGRRTHNEFAVLPEAQLNVGYDANCHVHVGVGYSFLYLSSVVRPGNQIDPTVNFAQLTVPGVLPGPQQRPLPQFNQSDFWAQGVNFSLEFRF